jgi:putative transposase
MPWKECCVREERFRFIEDWRSDDWTISELCRHYEVSRATGYKWISRYQEAGLDGLRDQSRAPHQRPNGLTEEMQDVILGVKAKHPTWGAPKIRGQIMNHRGDLTLPAESTIGALLKRSGLTADRRNKRMLSRPSTEPLAHACSANEVWSADFKGCFHTADRERIDPLTITDNYSRYLFRCQSLKAADTAHSKPVFEAAFREFGLPRRIRTDNGAPFGSNGETGLTALSAWWIRLGIVPERIQAGKPQQNGRHERMHRTLKQETASPPAANRRRQQERFDIFRKEYNQERPHQALGQKPPASFYTCSPRQYPERIRDAEYPAGWPVRRLTKGGQLTWKAGYVFVSHAMAGDLVGLEPLDSGIWRVWFYHYEAGILDEATSRLRRPGAPYTGREIR